MGVKSKKVIIDIVPTIAIMQPIWDEIWQLTKTFYDTKQDFTKEELKKRQKIALFRAQSDRTLIGMASIDIDPVLFQRRQLAVIYTSHVIIQPEYRGHNLLQKIGFRSFIEARLRFPFRPIYWFFTAFSYKSYLLLPHNFRDYWPRFDLQTPEWERGLMNQLATQFYASAWCAKTGIVARSGQKRLQPDTAPLQKNLTNNPDLEFYAKINPHHADGDMLVCLCPLNTTNWLNVGVRALQRARKSSQRPRELPQQT